MVIRVLLVDDHEMMLAGLRRLIDLQPGFEVVAQASTVAAGRRHAKNFKPDLIVLDLRMPDSKGPEEIAEMRRITPEAKVVILTGFGDGSRDACIEGGADAFIQKESPPSELTATLRRLFPSADESTANVAQLTRMEKLIAAEAAKGKTNAEIASEAFLSVPTVKTHLSHALRKLELRDRVELASRWPQLSFEEEP
ncbi:response regulator transcription factor [bacterium]|nr:MAG: response regulator transcription factor [bacterium]